MSGALGSVLGDDVVGGGDAAPQQLHPLQNRRLVLALPCPHPVAPHASRRHALACATGRACHQRLSLGLGSGGGGIAEKPLEQQPRLSSRNKRMLSSRNKRKLSSCKRHIKPV